jgi:hypothetical protein
MNTRSIAMACMSVAAVAAAVSYLAEPTSLALAVSVVDLGRVSAHQEIIYGAARTVSGGPLAGVHVAIAKASKPSKAVLKSTTRADGTFRAVAHMASGRYAISASVRVRGKLVTTTTRARLALGRAYRITIKQRRGGGLSVVPVRGY